MGRQRIAVRTKWQFGPGIGDDPAQTIMGNRQLATAGRLRGNPTEPQAVRFTLSAATLDEKVIRHHFAVFEVSLSRRLSKKQKYLVT